MSPYSLPQLVYMSLISVLSALLSIYISSHVFYIDS
jgi:hypothetical protein